MSARCGRCGKEAAGYAEINGVRYCHSDDPYPTCYMRESWDQARTRYGRGENEAADEGTPEGDLLWRRTHPTSES